MTDEAVVEFSSGERFQITLRPATIIRQRSENQGCSPSLDFDPLGVDPQFLGDANRLRTISDEDGCFHLQRYVSPKNRADKLEA